jgi:hypothetical protein
MKRDPDSYKPANLWFGVFLFLFSKRRFLEMAADHAAWVNLKAPDLRAAYLNGSFDPCSEYGLKLERDRFSKLRAQFWNSLIQMLVISALALGFGAGAGVVGISLRLHFGHSLGFAGAFLIAWAALFELGGPRLASWDGETICELLHPRIFQCFFLPGALLTLCSVLL